MVKPPFTARHGLSGIWIEDANGLTVADISPLIIPEEGFRVAELLANGTNSYMRRVELNREVGKLGGRPKKKTSRKLTAGKARSKKKVR